MDSQSAITSQSISSIDEFEDLEITQFDENSLRELLEEPNEVQEQRVESITQPIVVEIAQYFTIDGCPSLEKIEDCIDDVKWQNMMQESSSLDHRVTCPEGVIDQFYDLGEFGLDSSYDFYNAVSLDEIEYDSLWHQSS
ncbi:hypothetical protein A4A49_24168 [Nicotiana attenuata]|uniref:Uncharacterized protein n=1 Tax=Nicotiana attenuata TaxID=49451 RepID=A0A314LEU0_NICAT|nr:hypothetical protein A4A49_24168 [Nicotiana attenuata]